MSATKRASPASPQNPPEAPSATKQEKAEAKGTPQALAAFDTDEAQRFLTAVYGEVPGWLGLSWLAGESFRSQAFPTAEGALALAARLDPIASSIYLRTTTLRTKPKKRGEAEDSAYLPGLWADLDFGTAGHKHDPAKHGGLVLPPDADQAYAAIAASGLPAPTLLVHSGGGLYPWWLLDEPADLADTRDEWAERSDAWQRQLAAGAETLGYHYGSGVGDLARVLRLPGSVNRKTAEERPCRVVNTDGPRYSAEALSQALEDAQLVVERPRGPTPKAKKRSPDEKDELDFRDATDPGPFVVLAEQVGIGGVLLAAGWTECGCGGRAGVLECFTRPGGGSTTDHSAHTLEDEPHVLVVFSEEAGLPVGGGQRLTAGRVFAYLHHGGDMSAAAHDLLDAMRGGGSDASQALGLPAGEGSGEDGKKLALSVRLRRHVEANYDTFPAEGDDRIFVQGKQGGRAELLATNFVVRAAGSIGNNAAGLSAAAKEAATILAARASTEPPRTLALRVHYTPGRIVLDLAQTNSTRCVVVTPDGWEVREVPPRDVVFQTSGAALPTPERGGSVDELRRLMRWQQDDPRWLLVKGWLPCSLLANLPRPAVCLFGPQGSAKSTTGRFLTGVVDPKPAGVLGGGFGKNRGDDETKALKHYVPGWDNVSTLSDEGADFLSRMVTGDLIEKRQLYTDAGLVSISYRRTAIITGINMPRGVKPDTLDRLILVALQRIEGERLPEGKLDAEWGRAQPRVLAGVLDLAVRMLAGLPTAQNPAGLRMADYAEALWAIDRALYDAYRDNVTTARGDMAEDDPFIGALVAWLRSCTGQEWEGTAAEAVEEGAVFADFEDAWWPRNGKSLSEQLNKCSELLRAVGVTVTERRSNGRRLKHFVLADE